MALFLATYTNKVDKKGRVSVPASFRACLSGQSFHGIVAYHSFINPCVEACSMERMEQLYASMDRLDPFSEERDAFTTTVLGRSVEIQFDSEGRIVLPDHLIKVAKIDDTALFVGKGATFEIWNPAAFDEHATKAREIALKNRHVLGSGGTK